MSNLILLRLFERLPLLAGVCAVPSEWHHHLGADCFRSLPTGYLVNTRRTARWVPCRHAQRSCRRLHRIDEDADGRLIAYAQPGEACPHFEITAADRLVWRIDLPAMLADIASTLTLDGPPEAVAPTCWRLGTATKRRIPVFVSLATSVVGHAQNVAFVAAQKHERPVFFVPTASAALQPVDTALAMASGRLGVLADFLELDRKNRLAATLELAERWRDLDREPARVLEKLPLPAGATWAHLVVTLLTNGKINIAHRTGSPERSYSRAELGFENKAGAETEAWRALDFAAHHGCIPITLTPGKRDDSTRNRMRSIASGLQQVVNLPTAGFEKATSPFHETPGCVPVLGYWPLFKLRPQSARFTPPVGNYPVPVLDLAADPDEPPDSD
ncbi:MAG: hypothetical protein H2172_18625 [Opitutus sp.]|nr:hypothetical protein [Opitutus sp.]MCS6245849.1 hypothetical protein [Opitutus sp.]MCS6246805.1 hypothetical protein [Opitutus sp.]MCS6272887.1 hypothetical protein [Opitutus sp.]MCS6278432.1 hypothetical protein [Opitutus sp.]